MYIKQLYNDNLRKLPNEYGDVSVMDGITGILFSFDRVTTFILTVNLRLFKTSIFDHYSANRSCHRRHLMNILSGPVHFYLR